MLTVADEPAVRARLHAMTIEAYHQLGDAGVISERTELIRGAIIDKMSQSPLHGSIVECLRIYLEAVLPEGFHVRQEKPLTLADSEPEPDLAVVRGRRSDYFGQHPVTAEIVVEVCVSSEALDRLKLGIYAQAGVVEYWLVFPETRAIERHTDPSNGVFRQVDRAAAPSQLPSTVFPQVAFLPPDLFPAI